MRVFGLIGFPLTHSFSKKYFTEKFEKEHIPDGVYELFEVPMMTRINFDKLKADNPEVAGFNVTIPHKQTIMPLLDRFDSSASVVGAVNVVKKEGEEWVGYNSDYYGFMESLQRFLPTDFKGIKALVLGTGGASKAVEAALDTLGIAYSLVSRTAIPNIQNPVLGYDELTSAIIEDHQLIINTSPLGMYPNIDTCPALPYQSITSNHFLFDLVYNPAETLFLKKGKAQGAKTQFGLEMLHLQAEKAWEIWNQ